MIKTAEDGKSTCDGRAHAVQQAKDGKRRSENNNIIKPCAHIKIL